MIAINKVAETLARIGFLKSSLIMAGNMHALLSTKTTNTKESTPQSKRTAPTYGSSKLPNAAKPSATPAVGIGTRLINSFIANLS